MRLALVAGIALLALATGCKEDAVPALSVHHYNPTWSQDGRTVLVGLDERTAGQGESTTRNLLFITAADGSSISRLVPGFSPQNRIWGETFTAYFGVMVADRIQFYTHAGEVKGSVPDMNGVTPTMVHFADSGYIWAGKGTNGRWLIGMHIHDGTPWQPTRSYVLKDTVFDSDVVDVTLTGGNTYAVHLARGVVQEFTFGGLSLGLFSFPPLRKPDVWKTRLHAYRDSFFRRIYCQSDSGLVMIDLDRRTMKYVILGRIINFDVSPASRWLMMETASGDTWRHSSDGTPMLRMAPHHIMPSFTPDGGGFAAVGVVDRYSDTLTIRLR